MAELVAAGCLVLLVVGFVVFVAHEAWRARRRWRQVLRSRSERPDQFGLELGKQFGLGVVYVTLHQLQEVGLVESWSSADERRRYRLTVEGEAVADAWGGSAVAEVSGG